MRSSANLLILAVLAGCAADGSAGERPSHDPARPGPPPTPSSSSAVDSAPLRPPETAEANPGYDAVGRAAVSEALGAMSARHRALAAGSIAEVTALDSGHTILVRIDGMPDGAEEIELGNAAAAQLGLGSGAAVRVRAAIASPADAAALAAGRPAAPRIDAPAPLLAALRRKVSPAVMAAAPVRPPVTPLRARPAPVVRAAPSARVGPGRFRVQVAAVSSEARARQIAGTIGGSVEPVGALWRVRLGPFADANAARRARDGVARRGYADAQIVTP